jgi:hypothetical protein
MIEPLKGFDFKDAAEVQVASKKIALQEVTHGSFQKCFRHLY